MDEFAPTEVTLTRAEYAAGATRAMRVARSTMQWPMPARVINVVKVLATPVVIVTGLETFRITPDNERAAGTFLVVLIAFFCFFAWLRQSRYLLQMLPRDDGYSLRPHTITLDDTGLSVRSEQTWSHLKWSAIKSVDDHAGLILLFVDRTSATIVPRRAFADGAAADRFLATVLSRMPQGTEATPRMRSSVGKWATRIVLGLTAVLIVYHLARWIASGG